MTNNVLRLIVTLTILAILQKCVDVSASAILENRKTPNSRTSVETETVTEAPFFFSSFAPSSPPSISLRVLDKPHHLFIGRCKPGDEILHGENIVLNNDGKSQVSASIRINVEGPVNITCVNVHDQVPGGGGYPSYASGGVGFNYVTFNVTTEYGEGFNFYVEIHGDSESEEFDDELSQERTTAN